MVDISPTIAKKIAKNIRIPPRPELLIKVSQEINSDEPNLLVIADTLSRDVSLGAAMLQVVNSPAYGLSNRISSIEKATMLLGLKNVERIVTVVTLRNEITGKLDLGRFWETATEIAEICAKVALRVVSASTDDAYTFGLFRDCGMPLMMQAFSDYKKVVAQSESKGVSPATRLEHQHFGANHCEVGHILCKNWYLPDPICDAIYFHHHEEYFDDIEGMDKQTKCLLIVLILAERIYQSYRKLNDIKSNKRWTDMGAQVLASAGINEEKFIEMKNEIITQLQNDKK